VPLSTHLRHFSSHSSTVRRTGASSADVSPVGSVTRITSFTLGVTAISNWSSAAMARAMANHGTSLTSMAAGK
jgi:hypothetical protein